MIPCPGSLGPVLGRLGGRGSVLRERSLRCLRGKEPTKLGTLDLGRFEAQLEPRIVRCKLRTACARVRPRTVRVRTAGRWGCYRREVNPPAAAAFLAVHAAAREAVADGAGGEAEPDGSLVNAYACALGRVRVRPVYGLACGGHAASVGQRAGCGGAFSVKRGKRRWRGI